MAPSSGTAAAALGCSTATLSPAGINYEAQPQQGMARSHRIAIISGATVGSVAFVSIAVGMLLWWRRRRNQQIFFDVNGEKTNAKLMEVTHKAYFDVEIDAKHVAPLPTQQK